MNREIKFRAFDAKTNTMVFSGFHVIGEVTAFGGIETHIAENKCGATCSMERWNDIVLMQYTGLKDKNGKEIYDGDVVELDSYPFYSDGLRNYLGEVYWCDRDHMWAVGLHVVSDRVSGRATGRALHEDDGEGWAVIGNIHENPELLKTTP